jgi:hypothetical protein
LHGTWIMNSAAIRKTRCPANQFRIVTGFLATGQ